MASRVPEAASVAAFLQIRGQLVEEPIDSLFLDVGNGLAVDAGSAAVATHRRRARSRTSPAMALVVEGVEPSMRLGLAAR